MNLNKGRLILLAVISWLLNTNTCVQSKKRSSVEEPNSRVRCVNLNFVNNYNKPFKVWKQISNTKFKGFIVTGQNYKLKTIVSEEHSDSPVRYHAVTIDDDDYVKLKISGQDTISVMPFDCDDSFVELVVSSSNISPKASSASLSSRTLFRSDSKDHTSSCVRAVGGSSLAHDCCRFPFIYQSKIYSRCSDEDSPGMLWCATTANYDLDQKWGYCVQSS